MTQVNYNNSNDNTYTVAYKTEHSFTLTQNSHTKIDSSNFGKHSNGGFITKIGGPNAVPIANIIDSTFTTVTNHGLTADDEIIFFGVQGIEENINNIIFIIAETTLNTFTIKNKTFNLTSQTGFNGPSGFVSRANNPLISIDTTHNNQQLVVSKGITINGGEILLNKASAGTTINIRNNEMKSLTFNAESGISDIMTIDTRTGLEEIRILKSDISTLLATTINASSLTTLNGGLEMDNDKFTVEDDTGNTLIGGTLNTAGVLTSKSKAHLNGGLQMDGNKFVVEDGTGNTNIEGSLTVEN